MINMNDNPTIEVAISDGMGNMGKLVTDFIENKSGFKISGIYDPGKKSEKYHNFDNLDDITGDLLIEFSPADQINNNLSHFINKNMNLLIGSSGIDSELIEKLRETISEDQYICIIPNFSIGASLQKIFSKIANQSFNNVSIEERHHVNKKDAPSGTAINLANELSTEIRPSTDDENTETSVVNNINISSLRNDKYIAEQTVFFKGNSESISIDHIVKHREAYLEGINYILDLHTELKGFSHGLENIMIDRFKI